MSLAIPGELGGAGKRQHPPSPPGSGVWWLHTQILADTSGQSGYGQILDPSVLQLLHGYYRDGEDNTHSTGLLGGLSQLTP